MITLQILAKALGGEISGNQLRCPGPGHSAADRSLVIKLDANAPNGILFYSFAGDDAIVCLDHIRAKGGLPAFTPNNGKHHRASDDAIADALMAAVQSQRAKQPPGRIVAIYDYTDADGTLLYQVLKYDPKNFRQRRPDGKGGWIWNLDGVSRVPYRWPQLIKDAYAPICFAEGEKDADTLAALDLCSTTIASGKWTDEIAEAFKDRNVWIFEDKDKNEAGTKRSLEATKRLQTIATSIRIIRLPGLTGEPKRKDVTNWLNDMGHTKDELIDVCAGAQYWEPTETNEGDGAPEKPDAKPEIRPKLVFIDTSRWDDEPPPPREWAVFDRIPLRQTALFSGEGAAGKSSILLHLCITHALAKDWLGTLPESGPSFFIDCEDDDKELWRRSAAVIEHCQSTFHEATKGGLYLKSYAGADAVMATVSQKGKVEPTAIYNEILEAAGDLKPKMIGIASSANVFAGKESDRAQVQQFIGMLTRIAIVANGGVTLISHPSLTGITSDSGLSGTTQWHNAVRARFYIKSINPEPGEQPDTDLREIIFKKITMAQSRPA